MRVSGRTLKYAEETRRDTMPEPLELVRIASSETRRQILRLLLQGFDHPEDLAKKMKIRRTSVDKQLAELFGWGLVDRAAIFPPNGRPRIVYQVTRRGKDLLDLLERVVKEYTTSFKSDFDRELETTPPLSRRDRRWISRTSPGVGRISNGGSTRWPEVRAMSIAASTSGCRLRWVVPASSTISTRRPSLESAFRTRSRFVGSPCPIRTRTSFAGNVRIACRTWNATASGLAAIRVSMTSPSPMIATPGSRPGSTPIRSSSHSDFPRRSWSAWPMDESMSSTGTTRPRRIRWASAGDVSTTPTVSGIRRANERLANGTSRAFSAATRSW